MPRPDSVSSKAVMEKKRKHTVNQNKTEEVTVKENIQKPSTIGGNVEAGNTWDVFLEEAALEAEVRRTDRAADCPPSAQVLALLAGGADV